MKILTAISIGLMFLSTVVVIVFVLVGSERVWRFFGEPDLGPVSFEQLERRTSPNDALSCPQDVCTVSVDIKAELYPVTARELRIAFSKVIASEPRVTTVDANETSLTDRYIQRTVWLGFPDTIIVQFFERPGSKSTLAIYSRSQLGKNDLGANQSRIERWLSKLAEQITPVE